MSLPKLTRVRQTFDTTRLEDAAAAVATGLKNLPPVSKIKPGARIAITAGSRGIHNLVKMTRAAVDTVKALGGQPFVVPAMGSHGGATDEGQKNLLAELGISEAAMGCPVVSSVQVEEIGRTPSGHPVYFDKNALHADGVIAINRVKLHTIFRGEVESGLCKILAVGLGKHKGAQQIHRVGTQPFMVETARVILAKAPILAGVAVLENSLDETLEVHVVPRERFEATDVALLKRCWQIMPRIPFDPAGRSGRGRDGKEHQRDRHGHERHRHRRARSRQDDDGDSGRGRHRDSRPDRPRPTGTPTVSAWPTSPHGGWWTAIDYKSTYTNVMTTRLWSAGRLPRDPGDRPRGRRGRRGRDARRSRCASCGSGTRCIWRSWTSPRPCCPRRGKLGLTSSASRGPSSSTTREA